MLIIPIAAAGASGRTRAAPANAGAKGTPAARPSVTVETTASGTGPEAFNDRSHIVTNGYGGSAQLSLLGDVWGRKNNFTVGASADLGRTEFSQTQEDATFTPDRGTIGSGVTTLQTDVNTTNDYYGLYFTDVHSFNQRWHLTLSGRYNRTTVHNRDRITPGGGSGSLDGDHRFSRFNPAIGATWDAARGLKQRLEAQPIVIDAKAGSQGRLYGSVTTADVATAIQKQLGVAVDRRDLDINDPVRQVGSYPVTARLHRAVSATVTIEVRPIGGA